MDIPDEHHDLRKLAVLGRVVNRLWILLGVVIYSSTVSFLLAIGPYVNDQGKYVLWQDQGLQLFGLQRRTNLQDILAIPLNSILLGLGLLQHYPNTVQRARVDTWIRVVEAAVTLPSVGPYYYNLLLAQASSHLFVGGNSNMVATLSVQAGVASSLSGNSSLYADATVV